MKDSEVAKARSFWERTEGTVGMAVLSVATILGGAGFYQATPFINEMIGELFSTLGPVAGCGVISTLLYGTWSAVSHKRLRFVTTAMFKAAMREATGWFVVIKPIDKLKNDLAKKRSNLSRIDKELGGLSGLIRTVRDQMLLKKSQRDEAVSQAEQAKRDGDNFRLARLGRLAGRRGKRTITHEHTLAKLEGLYRTLSKMRERALDIIDDMEDQAEELEIQFKVSKSVASIMRNSGSISNRGTDAWELQEKEVEDIRQDFDLWMAKLELFTEMSEKFTSNLDLVNGVYEDDSLATIEEWEQDVDSILPEGMKQRLLDEAADPGQPLDLGSPVAPVQRKIRQS